MITTNGCLVPKDDNNRPAVLWEKYCFACKSTRCPGSPNYIKDNHLSMIGLTSIKPTEYDKGLAVPKISSKPVFNLVME